MTEITDQLGRVIRVPEAPTRLISLCPSTTETLFALGVGANVVGRTNYCIHPVGEVETVASIGGTKRVKIDNVAALEPDLVISVREENVEGQIDTLAERWPVCVLDPVDVDSAIVSIELLGRAIGRSDAAVDLATRIRAAFAELPDANGLRVAYFIWRKPFMVAGADTYIDDLLDRLGLVNVARQLDGRYPVFDHDAARRLRPEFLLASSEPFPFSDKHIDELRELGAEPVLVDGEAFGWHGARMLPAAAYFAELVSRLLRLDRPVGHDAETDVEHQG
ncbi:MAG: helical backbone metal receptor [Acidobacteriota bacterium]